MGEFLAFWGVGMKCLRIADGGDRDHESEFVNKRAEERKGRGLIARWEGGREGDEGEFGTRNRKVGWESGREINVGLRLRETVGGQ
jgi:hypothetical protein